MQQWEYNVEYIGSSLYAGETYLKRAGKNGWELVGIYKEDDGDWYAVFKRPE